VIVTADHGCDPTWKGTDHTREQVPVLVRGGDTSRGIGARSTFADVGASVAVHLNLPRMLTGRAF
jgi:phosphopentomutase